MLPVFQLKKKSESREVENLDPLPLAILCKYNQKIEDLSNKPYSRYKALLFNEHLYIESRNEGIELFKYGCFGKNEFFRSGFAKCDVNLSESTGHPEYSLNIEKIPSLSKERFKNRSEWLKLKKLTSNLSNEFTKNFHSKFLKEFLDLNVNRANLSEDQPENYCRIILDDFELKDNLFDNIISTSNNPFNYKIYKLPDVKINEKLVLSYEEVFYLAFCLDCIDVAKKSNNLPGDQFVRCLTINELWTQFIEIDKYFPIKYAVYHKLRTKGWVLKSGLKYGCDFMAYFKGPEQYHASYGIKIKIFDLSEITQANMNEEFIKFSSLIRINETAAKVKSRMKFK